MKTKLSVLLALTLMLLALAMPASTSAAATNDNFADATPITSMPFSASVDLSQATAEAGEPPNCGNGGIPSVWYAFTPASNTVVSASGSNWSGDPVSIYTGSDLGNLQQVTCGQLWPWGGVQFQANGGTTYYIQVGVYYTYYGFLTLNLREVLPTASFYASPWDPSVLDTVQACDQSWDPAGFGIQSRLWQFGDGATATGSCISHRYAADGDYNLTLTVTTADGRTGSLTQVVRVRSRDVAIARFNAPTTGIAGQTRQLSVDVKGDTYGATLMVRVDLYKSDPSQPGGFQPQPFGTLTQSVLARASARTSTFNFNYTFTGDDAAMGKVTFKAVATVLDANGNLVRDCYPADNTAIAAATKVLR